MENQEEKFICKWCNKECKNHQSLVTHEYQCSQNIEVQSQEFICEFCNRKCANNITLSYHIGHCKQNPNKKEYTKIQPKKKVCPLCNVAYNLGKVFDKHYIRCQTLSENERFKNYRYSWSQEKRDAYIAEGHYCENCGKLLTEWLGSGQYCSRACANSHEHTEEQKSHIAEGLANYWDIQPHVTLEDGRSVLASSRLNPDRQYSGIFCKTCGKELSLKNESGYCRSCINSAPEYYEARVEAGKKGYQTKLINGTHKGWQVRPIISYPELTWKYILEENNIPFEGPNYTIHREDGHCYFLDFYIEKNGIKLDLEIDGKQHKEPDRIIHDQIRTEYLESHRYTVYRVEWNDLRSDSGKSLMQNKIEAFLEYYNRL